MTSHSKALPLSPLIINPLSACNKNRDNEPSFLSLLVSRKCRLNSCGEQVGIDQLKKNRIQSLIFTLAIQKNGL